MVGPMDIVMASKMYRKVVFFLAAEVAAQKAVQKGILEGGSLFPSSSWKT